jgi:hypothetical protein
LCSSRSVVTEPYKGREERNYGIIFFFFPSLSTRLSPPPIPYDFNASLVTHLF